MTVDKILVIGVGNTIMGDDGLGVRALKMLRERPLPDNVDLLEAETSLVDVMPDTDPYRKIIIIDAIKTGKPGMTIIRDPFVPVAPKDHALSMHEVGIAEALKISMLASGRLPETVIVGLNPTHLDYSTELSESVLEALPTLVDAIIKEIENNKHCKTTRLEETPCLSQK